MKTTSAWAVETPKGKLMLNTIRATKWEAYQCALRNTIWASVTFMKMAGYRAVRVTVQKVKA